jgi:phosphoribosylformimino-5-aminoimidazole carboxamide ribotide isomerase
MLLIPAIDLKDGRCVRLRQGDMTGATVYSDQPGLMAGQWLEQGARRLHIVDLNGAVAGKPRNEPAIKDIVKAIGDRIPIQLGGGIRDLDTIERYLDDGVSYVIIGTAAVKTPGFLHDACGAFPGHIIVGLDAKDGKVAVDGWSKMTGHEVGDLAKKFEDYGVEAVIYTDIGRDGMLNGINIAPALHPRHRQWWPDQPGRRAPAVRSRGRGCRGGHHRARDLRGHDRFRRGAAAGRFAVAAARGDAGLSRCSPGASFRASMSLAAGWSRV